MNPIVFIAPMFALFVSLIIWGLLKVVRRWNGNRGKSRTSGCAIAAIAFPLLCGLFFIWLPRAMTSSGMDVSVRAANDGLHTISVPEAASDIDFRHSYFSGLTDVAEFTIDESMFLEWMKQSSRSAVEFYTDADGFHWKSETNFKLLDYISVTPVANVIEGHDDDLEVRNGYYFDDYEKSDFGDDSGLTVVYDKDSNRAYVSRTTY
jgi:hypothetical protein